MEVAYFFDRYIRLHIFYETHDQSRKRSWITFDKVADSKLWIEKLDVLE